MDEEGQWEDIEVIPDKEDRNQKIAGEQRLANLLNIFLASPQPTGSHLSQTWLDKNEVQRAALSRFWEGMRDRHRQTLERLNFWPEDIASDLQTLSADSDPDHISFVKAQREEIVAKIAERGARKAKKPRTPPLQTQWGVNSKDKAETVELKIKVKSRSSNSTDPSLITEANSAIQTLNLQGLPSASQADEHERQVKVSVSKRALSVFQSMFPCRSSEDRYKNVDWEMFVNAMGEVGFVARHSAGGAAVLFEPNEGSKWAGKGKIVFHKPHPVPTIDAVMLSSMGKRMGKWFDWSEDTFELEKK